LSGHAAGTPDWRALAIVSDGVHVLSASSWLGTLAIVLLAGLTAARRQTPEVSGPFVRSLINAFSPVALASAGIAAVTGVFATWLHVGTIPNLWGTRYGITLLVKLAILAVIALTGFYNWRFVQPRLGTDEATIRLERSARVEVAVAVLVLLVTAVLVASPTSMDAM
jgi:putative copper export protein